MAIARERLDALLDTLAEDQVETVLSFVTALSNGRAVMASCDVEEMTETGSDRETTGNP
jgi:hypothetical protein